MFFFFIQPISVMNAVVHTPAVAAVAGRGSAAADVLKLINGPRINLPLFFTESAPHYRCAAGRKPTATDCDVAERHRFFALNLLARASDVDSS